ncbi:pilus assembly protein TadG-related protein [Phreatobacter stygius]|uniref:Putative Flp pilus-assembly TadG-like N-terminal domain-containing protein n=1 Tax=Phreatobacter stygius TaxID=1940610 RepID=A0A4D7AXR3_9HYPH|nr:pilus assembly protein TadG-related protein [Phreatobacter stygius]QCI64265.1 hypothetical protein E8M01_08420 [Phreatobacter stygius]
MFAALRSFLRDTKSFLRDTRGSIAIISGVLAVVVIGFSAVSVDLGKVYVDRRKAQSVADLAALSAASDLTRAARAASATVQRNSLSVDSPISVELGTYTPNANVALASRFQTIAGATPNAARVTINSRSDLVFGRVITGKDYFVIRTTATAATTSFASFAIGSRLVAVDGGLLNQLLGKLLGTTITLSAMDYQSLVDAKLDLFNFMNKLAEKTHLTAGTYAQLLNSNIKVVDVLGAMVASTLSPQGTPTGASRALTSILQSLSAATNSMVMASLINPGPYKDLPVGQTSTMGINLSALDLLNATAQLANGNRQIEVGLGVNVPGIATATLKLGIGERPVGTSWVTVGDVGAQVHTAQTRLLLVLRLLGAGNIASVNVPLYVEVAAGTARLNALNCAFPDANASTMTLGVRPGVIDAWIGNVSVADFNNYTTAPRPDRAALVDTPLLAVLGRAHVQVTNMAQTPVTFTMAEINRQTKKTVGTTQFTQSLLAGLLNDLQLDVSVLGGLNLGLGGAVGPLVASILSGATPSIDLLLANLLQTLGVSLGQADVWGLGLRCDGAVLVQ